MIISHRHKMIFIKTRKTAGTSIEMWFDSICGSEDIVTPITPEERGHTPRNWKCLYNPIPELRECAYSKCDAFYSWRRTLGDLRQRRRYYNHMPARVVRCRVSKRIWDTYWKWCVERDGLEKTVSQYFMEKARSHKELSTEEFLERYNLPFNYPLYTDHEGRILVDEIVQYENLKEGLRGVCDRIGVEYLGLPFHAKSAERPKGRRPEEVFSEEQIVDIRKRFADEREVMCGNSKYSGWAAV